MASRSRLGSTKGDHRRIGSKGVHSPTCLLLPPLLGLCFLARGCMLLHALCKSVCVDRTLYVLRCLACQTQRMAMPVQHFPRLLPTSCPLDLVLWDKVSRDGQCTHAGHGLLFLGFHSGQGSFLHPEVLQPFKVVLIQRVLADVIGGGAPQQLGAQGQRELRHSTHNRFLVFALVSADRVTFQNKASVRSRANRS